MSKTIDQAELKRLFTKPYGVEPPTRKEWERFYDPNVIFIDPTQEQVGFDSYIDAQDKLIKRCDDVFLETHAISINSDCGFVEWTMGLRIMGKEFIYPGTTRLIFAESGLIKEHRDYFDFCGPTFGPIPVLGTFIRWLYARFVS